MTAQQLSERCRQLGAPIHRSTITKIENGRPRFDLGELVVLAAALNTSPVALVFPGPYDTETDLLPTKKVIEFDAAQWFSGLQYFRPIGFLEAGEDDFETEKAAARKWAAGVSALSSARSLADAEHDRMIRALQSAITELTTERAASKRLAELEKQSEIFTKRLDEIARLTGGSDDA